MKRLRRHSAITMALLALMISIATISTSLATVSTASASAASPSAASPSAAAKASTPACTFNASSFPIVEDLTPGATVQVDCTGLPALHPYLLFETSLLIGIDPATASLLSGGLSPTELLGVLSALPLLNTSAFSFPFSDLSGNLDYAYKTPTTQAPDPNASCPPNTQEFNSGLIGCALALVDLTTATAVGAGSAILQYHGETTFPPSPTVMIKPKTVSPGQTVKAKDVNGATTYWWLATLSKLEGLLGSSGPPPVASAKFAKVVTQSSLTVSPATYNGSTFTPPALSGTFVIPSSVAPGKQTALIQLVAELSGFPLTISATEAVQVK